MDGATTCVVGLTLLGVVMLVVGTVFPWLQMWFLLGGFAAALIGLGSSITNVLS